MLRWANSHIPDRAMPYDSLLRSSAKFLMYEETMTKELPLILIADDDPDLRQMLRLQLEDMACEIIEAHDGAHALELIITEHPNLVILDVMMPGLTGWEVLRYVRGKSAYDDVGVLMLTGIGETLNELSSPMYGADDFIDKPFKAQALIYKIRRILSKRGARPENGDDVLK